MNRKLSIIELAELVATKAQTTNRMSELFLKELFATVSQELTEGRGVEIKGLGSFVMPTAMTADEESSIEFAPVQSVVDAVNQPFAQFEPMELSDDLTPEQLQQLVEIESTPEEVEETPAETPEEIPEEAPVTASEETPEEALEEPVEVPESAPLKVPETAPVEAPEAVIEESPVAAVAEVTEQVPSEVSEPSEISEFSENSEPVEPAAPVESSEPKAPSQPSEQEAKLRKVAKSSLLKGIVVGALGALLLTSLLWILFGPRGVVTGSPADKADTTAVAATTLAEEKTTPASIFTPRKPQPAEPKKEIPVIRDTVTAKRPLTVIARKHYGNEFFYVYIYEENKDRISDVNNIAPGTEVIIPLASKYGFDPKDPESIKQAQLKSMELNKKR